MNNFILQYGKIGSYYLHNDYQVCPNHKDKKAPISK